MRQIAPLPLRLRYPNAVRVLTVLFVVAARRPARALQYDVDLTGDDASKTACTAAMNDCTLRGAIIASNANIGSDVINLPAHTYTLTITGAGEDAAATGDLDITDDLTIVGAGASTTIIDATGLGDRVIQTDPTGPDTITVTIQGVTVEHGNSPQIASVIAEGGGIRNGRTAPPANMPTAGTLHLVDVVVDHNTSAKRGGGISNDGVMTIVNSVVSHNTTSAGNDGGGIVQDDEGSLSITGTTIDGNDATAGGGNGGGLYVGLFSTSDTPVVTIDGSTISNNMAKAGGGVFRNRGSITVHNSTVSGNTSTQTSSFGGGGVFDLGGYLSSMLLASCTITNNTAAGQATGGGIQNNGVIVGSRETKLVNTLVAGNHAGSDPDVAGGILSAGYNLFGDTTGLSIDPASTTTGDIMGVNVANLHLGALGANGGATKTHALAIGSPALDAANPAAPGGGGTACPSTDQRNLARPIDGDGSGTARCDIGAFESQVVPSTPTPTTTTLSATKTPSPTPTKTATPLGSTPLPSVTATPNPTGELCDNCVDDDNDGLVDRDDPGCDQPLDGGAQGLGDAKRGKRLLKCAAAIQKAGTKLESKHVARLQKCLNAVFACTELKNGVAKCTTKAKAGCDKAFAAIPGDEAKLTAVLAKACGASVVDPVDLVAADGLGYGGHAVRCHDLLGEPVPVDAASLAACVAGEQACRADATLGIQVPRAAELLALVGHAAGELPCLPSGSGDGQGLGDAKRAKGAVKCEQAIEKAGAKLVNGEVKLVPKCANAVLSCLQLSKAKCAIKSHATCTKTNVKVNALAAKLAAAVTKACQASGLAIADVVDANGVGFGTSGSTAACTAAGVTSFANVGDVTTCLTKFHHCRAHQLLENQIPRLRELLGIGQLALP